MLPAEVVSGTNKRPSTCSAISGMSEELANMPAAEPDPAPYFSDDVSYKELHMLCRQHGHRDRDERSLLITRLLATDRIARKRAREDPEAEPPYGGETPSFGRTALRLCGEQRSCETPWPMAGLGDGRQ